ncbi:MAG: pentapeptide repeat-containing protein [Antarcticimicrobium sp.]|uniref:pentapeptide repeat-containing protein n=1 Tax=Antarcticimicrobium sp. TaxID=2824147 RepID=UPI0026130418|nr:pentapeptide repeat-containing protein [Antarcticimicrobium sp.]MDF1718736.1 pentapeptide repeat-containing protein [Antarcticimicrobium sp.]
MNTPTSTTLPIPPDLFWAIAGLGGCALFVLIIYGFLNIPGHNHVAPLERVKQRLGLDEMSSGLFLIALAFWGVLFLLLFFGLVWLIWKMIQMDISPEDTERFWGFAIARIAGLTATLGAVVALPFTLVRVKFTAEQTATAAETLFNDKISAASEGLHAMRQRWDDNVKQNIWEPDVGRRNAAIDQLERLVQNQPEEAPGVSQILSTYVRERSKEVPPISVEDLDTGQSPQIWANHDFEPATDMERAVRALGQIRKIKGVQKAEVVVDLRGANLQGFNLSDFHQLKPDYTDGNFEGAHMQCIDLGSATLDGAFLRYAKMQGAYLDNVKMRPTHRPANLNYARLQGAYFRNAKMPQALLIFGRLNNAHFDGANLSDAKLTHPDLQGTSFQGALMRGVYLGFVVPEKMNEFTSFRDADLTGSAIGFAAFIDPWPDSQHFPLSQEQIDGMFHDLSVNWPEFMQPSPHLQNRYQIEKDFIDAWHRWQQETGFAASEAT